MVSILVFVKRGGVLAGCKPKPEPDGCLWLCPRCNEAVIRVSFGVMNGCLHCACGAEVELIVDGKTVDIEELNVLPGRPPKLTTADIGALQLEMLHKRWANEAANAAQNTPAPAIDDEEFLRGCGILTEDK